MTHYQSTVDLVASSFKETEWQKNHNPADRTIQVTIAPLTSMRFGFSFPPLKIETNQLVQLYYRRRE